mgnify:CR=1 FL=1
MKEDKPEMPTYIRFKAVYHEGRYIIPIPSKYMILQDPKLGVTILIDGGETNKAMQEKND